MPADSHLATSARPPAGGPASGRVPVVAPAPDPVVVRSGPALVLVLALALAGCTAGRGSGAAGDGGRGAEGAATVVRVVDGDTLHVTLAGREETVRLIGIDTPESKKPDTPVECFAPEASARLGALLPPGTPLRLERDAEARDRYGRLLAYAWRADDDLFVNVTMAAEGYAATLRIAPNTAYADDVAAAERHARDAGLGLWGACGGPHVAR